MHDIDLMLKLQLEGNHEQARQISDKLESLGKDGIPVGFTGQDKTDIWFRHSFNRGWFLLQEGKYREGCELLEHGRYLNVYGNPQLKTNKPIFNPNKDDIKNKSIIISLEGGYGDEIIHARFATSFKKLGAKKVYLASVPELVSVLSRIEGVDKVILRDQAHTVEHDFWVPGFSAGYIAGHTFNTLPSDPYLTPLDDYVKRWSYTHITSDKIKVGIRWAGNPKFEHQQFRKFPEKFLLNLSKHKELQIYSLQRDHNLVELPPDIIDLQNHLSSWEDTLAAISNLDIVISSCTSVAHVAAALGKETWIIVPILPYHTWTAGAPTSTTSPYYKTVKLYRQTKKNLWNDTFQSLYNDLKEKFKLKEIKHPDEDIIFKRINLGCGQRKINDFLNVDKCKLFNPDMVVDLSVLPWPFKNNEFNHILAKDVLEYLCNKKVSYTDIIKEMYRISSNGALWEIGTSQVKNSRVTNIPGIAAPLTLENLKLFSRQAILEEIKIGAGSSLTAFEEDIDIEVIDMKVKLIDPFDTQIKNGTASEQEINFAIYHYNNIIKEQNFLVQVFKPPRVTEKTLTENIFDGMIFDSKNYESFL